MSQRTFDSDDDVWDEGTWDEEINTNTTMLEIPITKVTYPADEVLGFCDGVAELVNTYKTQMTANGNDPTAALALFNPAKTDLTTQNGIEQGIKTQLRLQTPITEAARDKGYSYASFLVDQLTSAFGRNSEIAKEATNLRKKLHPPKTTPDIQAAKAQARADKAAAIAAEAAAKAAAAAAKAGKTAKTT